MHKYALIIIIFIVSSCNQETNNENNNTLILKKDFNQFLKSRNYSSDRFKEIIIIPGSGCTGCISEAQKNFMKNYKDKSKLYIFTAIGDLKLFKLSFSPDAFSFKNTIIDSDNFLVEHGFRSVYPSEVILSDEEEVKINPYQN